MIKDGNEVQPGGEVEVSIPIPENLKIYAYLGKLKIYRVEEDGSTTEMNVKVENGCLVFRTNHFSLYSILPTFDSGTLGDVNSDDEVNAKDRMMLTRYLAKWSGYTSINNQAADVNQDGRVNAKDRMVLTRHLAKWQGYEALPV